MDAIRLNADRGADVFQKYKALIERIEKRQLDVRPHDFDRQARKTRTGAHIHELRAFFDLHRL